MGSADSITPLAPIAVGIAECAALMRVSANHVRNMLRSGKLAYSRLPGVGNRGRIVIQISAIRALLAETEVRS
jgi:hypothetical protein